MGKKSRRNVDFEDSDDDEATYHRQFDSDYGMKDTINSDEGECDDTDHNSDNVEFDDGYDEDLMGDDHDRAMLNAMTEVEREKELFKRMERREALKARHIIEKRLKAATTKERPSSTLTHENNTIGSGVSRPKRNLIKSNQQSIDLIRNKRMKRKMESSDNHPIGSSTSDPYTAHKNKNQRSSSSRSINTATTTNDNSQSPSLSPTDKANRKQRYLKGNFSDDNSEDEFDDTFHKKSLTPISNLEDFNKLRISRHKLTLWVYQPFFERKIPGFFVRFANAIPSQTNGGDDEDDDTTNHHRSGYQAFIIVEVLRSNKSYKCGDSLTNKFLRVRRGNDERVIRMEYVSNQLFTESEFKSYLEEVEKDDKPKPTLEDIEKKQADMKFCIEFRPTERDIDYIVEQKNKFRKVPVNITAERHKVQIKIEEAKQKSDWALVEKLENDLKNLDQQLEHVHKKRTEQLDKIRLINERNRRSNIAQLEKVLENDSSSWGDFSESSNPANNPFVRRRTNPMILSDRKLHSHFANKPQSTVSPSNQVEISDNHTANKVYFANVK